MPDIKLVRRSAARGRWALGATVLLMITLIWATWLEIATHENQQAVAAAARRQGNLAVAVSQYLTRALGSADAVGDFLGQAYASGNGDFPAQLAGRTRVNQLFSGMVACFEDGRVLPAGFTGSAPQRAQWCGRWLQEAPAGAQTYLALPVDASPGTLVPLLTRLPGNAAAPAGVLAMLVDVRALLGLLQEYSVPDETVVLIAGGDGLLRARWHSATGMLGQQAPELALIPVVLARGTPGQLRQVDGRDMIASARSVPSHPLSILVASSLPDTLAEARRRSLYYAAASALATLLIAVFALRLLRLQNHGVRVAESLGRARGRLQRLNSHLEEEVRGRTAELEAAYRNLEVFSYAVAHDVRAPITAIRGFAAALQPALHAGSDARAKHYLQRIEANASHMDELTASLLALGKLSRPPTATALLDLSATAQEVFAGLRERDAAPRHVLTRVQEGLLVRGDRVLLRQVLENLLGNAWKFSAARAPARIRVEGLPDQEGWLTVAVRDNGEGFDSASAVNLFQPFRRMHAAGAFAGTGIGLATVDRIVRLHGGRTWIESTEQDGTSVFFRLPGMAGGAAD